MLRTRIIPCLLLRNQGLVKTVKFKDPKYVGDPINAVKIFNEKEVDELVFLDITATVEGRGPSYKVLSEISSECFMPLAYGGGVRTIEDIQKIFALGVEKVVLNSRAAENPQFVREASDAYGSQSVVVSMDVKRNIFGKYEIHSHCGTRNTKRDPVGYARQMAGMGAGEIFLNSIDLDGTMKGYDIGLIKSVAEAVDIPVIACGGAGKIEDFALAVKQGGASAVSAGSMFVFQGKHRAVLISYPEYRELERII
jgi:cyclase